MHTSSKLVAQPSARPFHCVPSAFINGEHGVCRGFRPVILTVIKCARGGVRQAWFGWRPVVHTILAYVPLAWQGASHGAVCRVVVVCSSHLLTGCVGDTVRRRTLGILKVGVSVQNHTYWGMYDA